MSDVSSDTCTKWRTRVKAGTATYQSITDTNNIERATVYKHVMGHCHHQTNTPSIDTENLRKLALAREFVETAGVAHKYAEKILSLMETEELTTLGGAKTIASGVYYWLRYQELTQSSVAQELGVTDATVRKGWSVVRKQLH